MKLHPADLAASSSVIESPINNDFFRCLMAISSNRLPSSIEVSLSAFQIKNTILVSPLIDIAKGKYEESNINEFNLYQNFWLKFLNNMRQALRLEIHFLHN